MRQSVKPQLALRVAPKAAANAVRGWHAGRLKISVTAAPDKDKANQAVRRLLAKTLGLRLAQVRLIAGQHSQDKLVELDAGPDCLSHLPER